jgi:type IV pilus assembly protein PilX
MRPGNFGTRQRGMALITSVLLLIVMTIMALSMMRSYGIQERIAGNTRDKQRAINAAISAQEYAETWLNAGTGTTTTACTSVVVSTNGGGQVCATALTNTTLNTLPWTAGVTYSQFTQAGGNGVMASLASSGGTVGAYSLAPVYYIADMGTASYNGTTGELYQIDAVGYGGSKSTVAIVESTYLVSANAPKDPTQP